MSRRDDCRIEVVIHLRDGLHLELVRLTFLRTDLHDDAELVVHLDDVTQFQSWPRRVVVDLDDVLLSHHLANQDLCILLSIDDRFNLRELVVLAIAVLLVERRDMLLLFLEVVFIMLAVALGEQRLSL